MPEFLTTAQMVLVIGIVVAGFCFQAWSFFGALGGNLTTSTKGIKAAMLLYALAAMLVLLALAKNKNFDLTEWLQ